MSGCGCGPPARRGGRASRDSRWPRRPAPAPCPPLRCGRRESAPASPGRSAAGCAAPPCRPFSADSDQEAPDRIVPRPEAPVPFPRHSSSPRCRPAKKREQKPLLTGEIGSSTNPPSGCRFHPRCPYATESCRQEVPELCSVFPGSSHLAACPYAIAQLTGGAPAYDAKMQQVVVEQKWR